MTAVKLNNIFKGDRGIWAIVVLFMLYSLLAVYSSSVSIAYVKYGGDTGYFLRSQIGGLFFGLIIIIITSYLPYRVYSSLATLFLVGSIVLLVLTLFVGVRINEATRWLEIPGTGFRIQTSDFAKVALMIYIARMLSQFQDKLDNFLLVFKVFIIPIGIVVLLIVPENMSTGAMVFGIGLLFLFVGRVPFRFLLAYGGMAIAALVIAAVVLSYVMPDNRVSVWKNRIENFVSGKDDDAGNYQANQAKIAISTGGIVGKAPGKSTQRNILPQSNSDFIFAIIIEEYGLLFGALPLILAYVGLFYRGIAVAKRCETAFPAFLVLGLVIMIVSQAFLNMMVAVGLFPVTGQTLPMISWGRSSVMVMSASIGIILSVSRVVQAKANSEVLDEGELVEAGEKIFEPVNE